MRRKAVNLLSLTGIQVANGVLPLLIFPFALGVVGADLYGRLALSEAVSIILLTIVLYSFEIDGVAELVGLGLEKDRDRLSRVFSAILCLRMALFAVAAPLILLGVLYVDREIFVLTAYWMLVPLSYAVQSSWLFLGLERNAPLAVFTVISRATAVALIVILVEEPAHYARVPLVIGSTYLAGAIASLLYVRQKLGLSVVAVPRDTLTRMFWSGKEIFAGNLSGMLFRDVNVLVLGVLGSSGAAISTYSIAEKIVKAMQASMRPLNQLFFPEALRIGRAAERPTPAVLRQLLRITWPQIAVLLGVCGLLGAGYLLFGRAIPWFPRIENADRVAGLVGFMSVATLLGTANFTLGWAGLVALGERRYLFGAILLTGLLSLTGCFVLGSLLGETGAAICFVLAEALFLGFVVRRYVR